MSMSLVSVGITKILGKKIMCFNIPLPMDEPQEEVHLEESVSLTFPPKDGVSRFF
jgi:hypothetical protein